MTQAATAEQWEFLRSDLVFLGSVEATPYAREVYRKIADRVAAVL